MIVFLSLRLCLCCRPNTGRSPYEEEKADLLNKYNKISLEDAGEKSNGKKAMFGDLYWGVTLRNKISQFRKFDIF